MTENYVSTKVKAEEWGMSLRTVQHACKDGRVPGAKKVNKEWLVPINAMSPVDARTAKGRTIKALGIDFREKEKFVTDTWTSVIHNVRNALSTIMGDADLIRLKEGDTEKILEYVEYIQKAGKDALNLTGDFIEYVDLRNGKTVLREENVNLKNLIQNVVESKNTEAKRRGIRILQTVDILHEDIVADAAKLMNILEKVLNNGVEFSKDEDVVQLKVEEIDSDRNTCTMRYTIKDLGVGMDDTSPKALFETFLDDSDESKDPNNLGLGLPIVKKLIDLMNGSIEIQSKPDFGTIVEIVLTHVIAKEKRGTFDETVLKGKKILLVEDNSLNREITAEILSAEGCIVHTVENGIACLSRLTEKPTGFYDLIFMDIYMPIMDGIKTAQVIRGLDDKRKSRIPIIALTASITEADRKAAIQAGMNGFAGKPLDIRQIIEIVNKLKIR